MSPPNQLTLLRILLTPVFVVLIFSPSPLNKQIAFGIFILAALTDWYDGYIARRWGFVTRWGKFFDPLADKILTSAAFFSFISLGFAEAWMVWIIVSRDICITLLRSFAELKNKPIDTSSFAKTKTFLQLIVIYFILIVYIVRTSPTLNDMFGPSIDTIATPLILSLLMLAVTVLTATTGVFYIVNNRLTIKELLSSNGRIAESE